MAGEPCGITCGCTEVCTRLAEVESGGIITAQKFFTSVVLAAAARGPVGVHGALSQVSVRAGAEVCKAVNAGGLSIGSLPEVVAAVTAAATVAVGDASTQCHRRMCRRKLLPSVHVNAHFEHAKHRILLCVRACLVTSSERADAYEQPGNEHAYGFSLVCTRSCRTMLPESPVWVQ
jgi:hypothetical protein